MEIPDVQYARSGDVAIAYQVVGEGATDILFARGVSGELLSMWEHPLIARHVAGLAEIGRLLMLDKRGTGLSDRMREAATLEARIDDLGAVMDAVGSQRAVLWASMESARLAIVFAATYPERTSGPVLLEPWIRGRRTPDYPWAPSDEEWRHQLAEVAERWGRRDYFEELTHEWAPDGADDPEFVDWFVTHMRRGMSPGAAVALFRAIRDSDVADVLGAVRVPTMVMFKPEERGPAEYVADRVSKCELVELGRLRGIYTWIDDETHAASMAAIGGLSSAWAGHRSPTACSRPSCSRTSSAPARVPRRSATAPGATSCARTTRKCGAGSRSSAARSSMWPATASLLRSTAPAGRSGARVRSVTTWRPSTSSSAPASTRANASGWTES